MNIGLFWANLSLNILPSDITNCKTCMMYDFDMIFVKYNMTFCYHFV